MRIKMILFGVVCATLSYAESGLEIFSEDNAKFYLFVNGAPMNESAQSKVSIYDLPPSQHTVVMVFTDATKKPVYSKIQLNDKIINKYAISSFADAENIGGYELLALNHPSSTVQNVPVSEVFVKSLSEVSYIKSNGKVILNELNPERNHTNQIKETSFFKDTVIAARNKNITMNVDYSMISENTPIAAKEIETTNVQLEKKRFMTIIDGAGNRYTIDQINSTVSAEIIKEVERTSGFTPFAVIPLGAVTVKKYKVDEPQKATPVKESNEKVVAAGPNVEPLKSKPLTNDDLTMLVRSLGYIDSDKEKLDLALKSTNANTFSVAQVKSVVTMFNSESTKISFAKYAYEFCFDKQNFSILNEVLGSQAAVAEVNKYIGR